jgi:hypothetical protein
LGYRGRHLDLWYTNKKPGEKWTEPKMIFNGYVGSVRVFIQLKNGRLVIPDGVKNIDGTDFTRTDFIKRKLALNHKTGLKKNGRR